MVAVVLVHHKDVVLHQEPPIQTFLIVQHGFEVLVAREGHLQLLLLDRAHLLRQRLPLVIVHLENELLQSILELLQMHIAQVELLLVGGELGQIARVLNGFGRHGGLLFHLALVLLESLLSFFLSVDHCVHFHAMYAVVITHNFSSLSVIL